jgi:anti-sigma regulatory factor (Ser/Thr protein kinase)
LTHQSSTSAERFRHEALFYSTSTEFINGTVPFIRSGLASGEPVLVVEPPPKIDALREALGADADRVFFADMSVIGANPARIIPAWQEFVTRHQQPGKSLRGIGEPIWSARPADELSECQRHESLLNVAFAQGPPWSLLCPYDTATLGQAVLDEALRSHEFVIEGGSVRNSDRFRGIDACAAPLTAELPSPPATLGELTIGREGLRQVRDLVMMHGLAAGLGESRTHHLVTSVNEVVTNSIMHGDGTAAVRIWRDEGRMCCEVRGQGAIDKPLVDREAPGLDLSSPRGLWVANQLCDLVQIRTSGDETTVRLHMRLDPRPTLRLLPSDRPSPWSTPD